MKVLQDHPMNIPTKLGCNWASGITERRRLNTDNKLLTPMGLFFLLGTSDHTIEKQKHLLLQLSDSSSVYTRTVN